MSLPAGPSRGATEDVLGGPPSGSLSPGQRVQASLTLWAGGQRPRGKASPKWYCWLLQAPAPRLPRPTWKSSAVNGYELQSWWHFAMPGSGLKIRAGQDCPSHGGELLDLGERVPLIISGWSGAYP